jgi:hypothetical protein
VVRQSNQKIATNSDAQEEADRQNTYRLAAIEVKEGVAAGITKIIGKDITNPILRTSDGISFKSVDEYQLHQLVTAITEGAERPEATTIRQQFVNIARWFSIGETQSPSTLKNLQ